MICLDSCFIIDVMKGKQEAADTLAKYEHEKLFITEMAVYEVSKGLFYSMKKKHKKGKKDFDLFMDFIGSIELIPCTTLFATEGANMYANLEVLGKQIGDNDCLTAGMMLSVGCKRIITKNTKHFSRIKGIEVIGY